MTSRFADSLERPQRNRYVQGVISASPGTHLAFLLAFSAVPMIQLHLLGAVGLVSEDGCTLHSTLAQPKRFGMLVYLAAASPRGFHPRDRLLELFWPESSEADARHSLNQALYFLRRSLGEGVVVSRGEEVGIDPERLACDAVQFDTAVQRGSHEEAMALYRGHLLEGFFVADATGFEQWMERERRRLRDRATSAALQLSMDAEARGDHAGALHWASRACDLAPDQEASLRRVLLLLGRGGERAAALQTYDTFAKRYRAEYGLQPSSETRALVESIRVDEQLDAAVVAERSVAAEVTPSTRKAVETVQATMPAGATASRLRASPPPRRKWIAICAGLLLILAGAGWFRLHEQPLDRSRILVVPFENRTGDAALASLGSLAADRVVQGLGQTDLVEVIDPTTALLSLRVVNTDTVWSDEPSRIRALAQATRAGTIVWGSYYRSGDSIRLQAHVTDVSDGRRLRTAPLIIGPADTLGLLVEATRERLIGVLASIFDERLASLSAPSSPAPTLSAYHAYVRGVELFSNHGYEEAKESFYSSARQDSTFALPLIWAAFALGNTGGWSERDSVLSILSGRRERLAPLDRHALDYFNASVRGDLPGSLEPVRQAARLAPGSNWTYMLGRQAKALNRPREAVQALSSLDPEIGWIRGWEEYWDVLTSSYHLLGEHEKELRAARRGRALNPQSFRSRAFELQALAALGRVDAVDQAIGEALSLPPQGRTPGDLMRHAAVELRAHGHEKDAERLLKRAVEWYRITPPDSSGRVSHQAGLAQSLYLAGQWSAAQEFFESLAADRPDNVNYRGYLGVLAARRGDAGEARRIRQLLQEPRFAREGATAAYWQARIAALEGDRRRALAFLRQAIAKGLNHGAYFPARSGSLHSDIDLESLRHTREFQEMLRPKS